MNEIIRVAILENEVEASLLGSLLEQEDIPHTIQSFHDSAYDGIFQAQRGWGCILAPADCRDHILAVLDELRHRPPDPSG